jgi:hypothetical protein
MSWFLKLHLDSCWVFEMPTLRPLEFSQSYSFEIYIQFTKKGFFYRIYCSLIWIEYNLATNEVYNYTHSENGAINASFGKFSVFLCRFNFALLSRNSFWKTSIKINNLCFVEKIIYEFFMVIYRPNFYL